jgi:hypothetical protein
LRQTIAGGETASYLESGVRPKCTGTAARPTDSFREKERGNLPEGRSPRKGDAVLSRRDEPLLVEEVHVAVLAGDLLGADPALLAGLVQLRRGLPEIPVLAEVVQVALLSLDLFLANTLRHCGDLEAEEESPPI